MENMQEIDKKAPLKLKDGYLRDVFSQKSSKRLWGSIVLSLGIILLLHLYYCSVFLGIKDAHTARNLVDTCFWIGGGLLGLGIFEGITLPNKE